MTSLVSVDHLVVSTELGDKALGDIVLMTWDRFAKWAREWGLPMVLALVLVIPSAWGLLYYRPVTDDAGCECDRRPEATADNDSG